MQGILGANMSKHPVYVVVCICARMRTCACRSGQVWGWMKIAYVYNEPGKYLVRHYTNEYGCLHGAQPAYILFNSWSPICTHRGRRYMCTNPQPFLFLKGPLTRKSFISSAAAMLQKTTIEEAYSCSTYAQVLENRHFWYVALRKSAIFYDNTKWHHSRNGCLAKT